MILLLSLFISALPLQMDLARPSEFYTFRRRADLYFCLAVLRRSLAVTVCRMPATAAARAVRRVFMKANFVPSGSPVSAENLPPRVWRRPIAGDRRVRPTKSVSHHEAVSGGIATIKRFAQMPASSGWTTVCMNEPSQSGSSHQGKPRGETTGRALTRGPRWELDLDVTRAGYVGERRRRVVHALEVSEARRPRHCTRDGLARNPT